MEYNDFLLPKQKEFEKLAKAYNEKLAANHEISPKLIDNVLYSLKFLEWLYCYTKKRVNSFKFKNLLKQFEGQCFSNFSDFSRIVNFDGEIKLNKSKRLRSLNSCIKLAIYTESELVEFLFSYYICNNSSEIYSMICEHLKNIKTLIAL